MLRLLLEIPNLTDGKFSPCFRLLPPSSDSEPFFGDRFCQINKSMQILSKSLLSVKTGIALILRWATNAEPFIDEGELVGGSFGVLLCAVWIDPWGGSEPGRTGAGGRTGLCVWRGERSTHQQVESLSLAWFPQVLKTCCWPQPSFLQKFVLQPHLEKYSEEESLLFATKPWASCRQEHVLACVEPAPCSHRCQCWCHQHPWWEEFRNYPSLASGSALLSG